MEEVARLEHAAHQLEQDGDDMKAIRLMERAAALRGESSDPETAHAIERLVIKYNTVAVRCFKADDYDTATALLANAANLTEPNRSYFENAVEPRLKLRGTTFNNMGCMERRRGRLEQAAKYLRLSLEHDGNQSAVTYLNLAAIYTQMRRAEEAVACARRSIGLLSTPGSAAAVQNPGLIAVAHHNLAMALEHLDRDACASAFETALSVSKSQLGASSPTTTAIQRNYERFLGRAGHRDPSRATSQKAPPSQTFLPPLQTRQPPATASGATRTRATTPRREAGTLARTPRAGKPAEPKKSQQANTPRAPSRRAPDNKDRQREPKSRATDERKPAKRHTQAPTPKTFAAESETDDQSELERDTTPPPRTSSSPRKPKEASASGGQPKGPMPTAPKPPTVARDEARPAARLRHIDVEEEKRKDDVVAFMVSRLGALLRAEEEFELRYHAAVKIQCLARGIAAREASEKRKAARAQGVAMQELRERKAANALIEFFRMLVDRRKAAIAAAEADLAAELQRHKAAIKIQATARRWLAKQLVKRLRVYYRDYTRALRKLQCWFRVELAKARIHKMRLVQADAIRRKLADERCMFAATQIQRSFRAFLALKATATKKSTLRAARERDRESNRSHSVKRLQAFWRKLAAKEAARERGGERSGVVQLRERAELREVSAIAMQALARGWLSRRRSVDVVSAVRAHRERVVLARRMAAATRIQCLVRRAFASTRVKNLRWERRIGRVMERQAFAAPIITAFVQAIPTVELLTALSNVQAVHDTPRREHDAEHAEASAPVPEEGLGEQAAEDEVHTSAQPEPVIDASSPTHATFPDDAAIAALPDERACIGTSPRPPSRDDHREGVEAPQGVSESPAFPSPPGPEGGAGVGSDSISTPSESSQQATEAAASPAPGARRSPSPAQAGPVDAAAAEPPVNDHRDTVSPVRDEPYVVPPRVSTPAKLKLSVAYLEERRKRELAERQRKRLAEFDGTLKPEREREEEAAQRQRAEADARDRAAKQAAANRAAERIQAFFRGIFERSLYRQKQSVVAEYLDALVEKHRHALQPRQPPGAPRRHRRASMPSAAEQAHPRSDFTVLEAVTAKLGDKVERQARVQAATLLQAALRTHEASKEARRRGDQRPQVERAARTLTSFGRVVLSRTSSKERTQKLEAYNDARARNEQQADRVAAHSANVVMAFAAGAVSCAKCATLRHSTRERAASVLGRLARVVAAKRTVADRQRAVRAERDTAVACEQSDSTPVDAGVAPIDAEHGGRTDAEQQAAALKIGAAARGFAARQACRARAASVRAAVQERVEAELAASPAETEPAPRADSPEAAPRAAADTEQPADAAASQEDVADEAAREAAALRIQCATRQRQARAAADVKRRERRAAWEDRKAAADDEATAEDAAKFETPDRASQLSQEVQAAETDAGAREVAAATAIQRTFRGHEGRRVAAQRREQVAADWQARRQRIAEEEDEAELAELLSR